MRLDKDKPGRVYGGLLGRIGPEGWAEHQLISEMESVEDGHAPPKPQPVSVRLDPDLLVLIDALAERFELTRSRFLVTLLANGACDVFHALGVDDRERLLAAMEGKVREPLYKEWPRKGE